MTQIMSKGHSRVPIHSGNPRNIIGLILVSKLTQTYHKFKYNFSPYNYNSLVNLAESHSMTKSERYFEFVKLTVNQT